jgi:hypothetical protein
MLLGDRSIHRLKSDATEHFLTLVRMRWLGRVHDLNAAQRCRFFRVLARELISLELILVVSLANYFRMGQLEAR